MNKARDFLERHSILGAILLYVAATAIIQVFGSVFDILIERNLNSYPGSLVSILLSFLTLWIFKRIFKPDYDGALHLNGILKGLLYIWPLELFFITLIFAFNPDNDIITYLVTAVWAGVNEEVCIRGVALAFLTYHFREQKHVPLILWGTSLVFALTHIPNMFIGGSVSGTILQTISALGLGAMFAASFMRTGTLWPAIIIHSLNDFLVFMASTGTTSETVGVNSSAFDPSSFLVVLPIYCVYIAVAFFCIRKTKREEIVNLWNRKWGNENE